MKLIKDLGMLYKTNNSKQRIRFGIYECPKCFNHFKAATTKIKNKRQKGCTFGCTQSTSAKDNLALHGVWLGIKQRCNNEKNHAYKNYGGRGIKLSDEWNTFNNFSKWANKNGYKKGLTIERINVNKGYSHNNCTWISKKYQTLNKRNNINFTQDEMSEIVEFYEYNHRYGNQKELLNLIKINKTTFNQIRRGDFQINNNMVYTCDKNNKRNK